MADNVLKDLLKEYEIKRLRAEQIADKNIESLFSKYPEFEKINSEIAKCGLSLAKEKLQSSDFSKVNLLKQKLELLKANKHSLLEKINLTESDLLPKYECSICNDTGYIHSNGN